MSLSGRQQFLAAFHFLSPFRSISSIGKVQPFERGLRLHEALPVTGKPGQVIATWTKRAAPMRTHRLMFSHDKRVLTKHIGFNTRR